MTDRGPERVAVVVPGRLFGPGAPLLMYSAEAAHARGARVDRISWTDSPELQDLAPLDAGPWVRSQVEPVLDAAGVRRPLVIAKSLGTHAAALAAERQLPAIWLTPLLMSDEILDALRRATAPRLLVGGTRDRTWDGRLARELSPYVLEVEGADHAMYVSGPLAGSAEVLGRVATAVERFLDDVVWR